jgi:hypothetical protein
VNLLSWDGDVFEESFVTSSEVGILMVEGDDTFVAEEDFPEIQSDSVPERTFPALDGRPTISPNARLVVLPTPSSCLADYLH